MTTDPHPETTPGPPCTREERIACPCTKHPDARNFFELWCSRYVAGLDEDVLERLTPQIPAHVLESAARIRASTP